MQSTRTQKPNYRSPSRWNTVSVPERVAERAYTKHVVDESGCWISTYSTASHGYAQIGWQNSGNRHVVLAHRAAWVHVNGQVPIGVTLDHTCKVRPCVNPGHLRLLPNWENARRNQGDDWEFGTCRNGHPNTELVKRARTAKSGRKYMGLQCFLCEQDYNRRWADANPEKYAESRRKDAANRQKLRAKAKPKARELQEIPWKYF